MTLWLLPSAVAVVVLAGLTVFLFVRRPPAPLWPVAVLCQVAAFVWVSGDLLTYFATTATQKQLALAYLLTGSLSLPALWWVTAVRYVRSHHLPWRWVHSPWAMLPSLVGAAGWLVMITNPSHGGFVTPVVGGRSEYHALALPFVFASFAMIPSASVLFLALSRQVVSQHVRRSALILAFSAMAPLAASGLYFFSGWEIPIDPVCIGLSAACGAMIWGVYHTGLFSLLPVALPEVLRHDPNGVLLVRESGQLLHWNPAAERILDGLRLAPELDLFPALQAELREADGSALEHSDPATFARTICREPLRSQGHVYRLAHAERWVRLSLATIPSRKGDLAAVSLRVEDVTPLQRLEDERRELESRVRHAEKLKSLGLLAGGIAHDFNNLLGSIRGNINLALQESRNGVVLREHLVEIEDAALRAAELTFQLLTYGGNAPSTPSRVDLPDLITEMVRLLEVSVSGRATLQTDFGPGPTAVDADPAQLRQLVMNLITNAAEAVEDGDGEGVVRLHTREVELDEASAARLSPGPVGPGRHVVLEVSDTGSGMSEEVRSKIFDPFFSTRRDGRGLGMAVVFGCVHSLHGGVEIESDPGSGTTVRVTLPVSRRPARTSSPPADSATLEARAAWKASGTVLVVDDEPRMLRVLSAILRQSGFEVITAASGREAIDRFLEARERIRLVLLDLTMPDLGGEEVLAEIRGIEPEARVVLISGFAEGQVMARLSSSKLSAFLQKPFDSDDLLDTLRRVLQASEASDSI